MAGSQAALPALTEDPASAALTSLNSQESNALQEIAWLKEQVGGDLGRGGGG